MSAVLGPGVDEPVCPRCCSRRCASIPARMAYRAAFKAWPRDATDADYDAIAALVDAIPEDCEPASPWKLVERVEALTEENARLRAPAPALAAVELERIARDAIDLADIIDAKAPRGPGGACLSGPNRSAIVDLRQRLDDALSRAPAAVGVPADLDEAIEAYRRAAIAEHLTGADRSASIGAQRAAVVTLQDAHDALLAAISRRVPGDLAGLLRENLAAYEAWLSGVDDGDSLRFNRSQKAIADWTRASLGDPE